MIIGSFLITIVHLIFSIPGLHSVAIAVILVILLGIGFSLVPSAMWPSVAKIIPESELGTAYALIFWIQNIGLWLFPLLIGKVLDKTNVGVTDATKLDYTWPLIMLACLGIAALLLGLVLKEWDKKKGLGLEQPNVTD